MSTRTACAPTRPPSGGRRDPGRSVPAVSRYERIAADLDRAYDPFAVASFTEALRERGLAVETRLLSVDPRARSAPAAAALGTAAGEDLVALTRVRLIEGRPIVYQVSYAPGRVHG